MRLRDYPQALKQSLRNKPLSTLSAAGAILVIAFSVVTIRFGNLYVEALNSVDATTLVMAGLLWVQAVWKLRVRSDLQTFSMALIAVLSFIFAYEAIYKASFYGNPASATYGVSTLRATESLVAPGIGGTFFGIPASQLREGIIDIAIALTVAVGFAYGIFSFSRYSKFCVLLFAIFWAFWLIVGFPQIYNLNDYHSPIINIQLNWAEVYLVNRGTKFLLFLAYFFLFKEQ